MERELESMWNVSTQEIVDIDPAAENWKIQTLPLARVKKIMKSEEIILQELEKGKQQREDGGNLEDQEKPSIKFMISGEAPVLMSKACELLIKDLSFRAWRHTERNRRRTLQRQDLHAAVGESEVYDFLIDIVPRVTTTATEQAGKPATVGNVGEMGGTTMSHNLPQMGVALTHTQGIPVTQTQAVGGQPVTQTPGTIDPNTNPPAILNFQPTVDLNENRGNMLDQQFFMTYQMQGADGSDPATGAVVTQGGHQVQGSLPAISQHQPWGDSVGFTNAIGGGAPTQAPGL